MKDYFKFLLKLIAIATLIFFMLSSCGRTSFPTGEVNITRHDSIRSDSTSYKQMLQKTIVDIPADSSSFAVTFGCDSLKRAFIRQIADLKSKGVITSYSFHDNTLYFTTKRDALQQAVYTLETELKQARATVVHDNVYIKTAPVVVIKNSKFAKICTWWFFISLVSILGYTAIKLKLYKLVLK